MKTINNNGINKRAFVACGLFLTGLGLPLSGLMILFFAFGSLNNEKLIWLSVNNVLGVLFIFFASLHIYYNWKTLTKYFRNYTVHLYSKELILASVLIFVLIFAAVVHSVLV